MTNKIKMMFLINICLIMTYPEFFSQPEESKRAKKMLELVIPSLSGLDESKADKLTLESILGYFHSPNES
jgi:hypothetical protein